MKITNWNGCIPEEVREESGEGGEFMPIYPFEKVIWPKKVGSPFLVGRGGSVKGMKGPGGIVNVPVGNGVDGGGDGDNTRKKPRSDGNSGKTQQQQQQQQQPPLPPSTTTAMATLQTAHAAQTQNPYQHIQQPYVQQQQIVNQTQTQRSTTLGPDRSIITAAGGIAAIGGSSQVEKLPAETGKLLFDIVDLLCSSCSLLSSMFSFDFFLLYI